MARRYRHAADDMLFLFPETIREGVVTQVNVGRFDQAVRIAIGLVLLGFALFCPWGASFGAVVTWPSGVIGAALLTTGLLRRCPTYSLLGVRTNG
jgi:hypothetical protein